MGVFFSMNSDKSMVRKRKERVLGFVASVCVRGCVGVCVCGTNP